MRFLFRFLSMVCLVLAVIAGTVDSIQSVSASDVVLTSFGSAWLDLSPVTLMYVEEMIEHYLHPWVWNPALSWVLFQPTFAVFLVLALAFWIAGYRRENADERFAV